MRRPSNWVAVCAKALASQMTASADVPRIAIQRRPVRFPTLPHQGPIAAAMPGVMPISTPVQAATCEAGATPRVTRKLGSSGMVQKYAPSIKTTAAVVRAALCVFGVHEEGSGSVANTGIRFVQNIRLCSVYRHTVLLIKHHFPALNGSCT